MNDFTKDELEQLWKCTEIAVDEYSLDAELWDIQKKLKSMIENYCEIKAPKMDSYTCLKCNEEWHKCECGK